MEYPKTENLYAANGAQDSTSRSGPEFGFRVPGVGLISKWLVTEKVDGMNMRVVWRPHPISEKSDPYGELLIYGRTDRAQIPGDLAVYMRERFTHLALRKAFDTSDPGEPEGQYPEEVVLFGEGFGPGIQKAGQAYGGEKRFILFDVVVNGVWLSFDDVEDVARKLDIPTVPVLCKSCTLDDAKAVVNVSVLQPRESEHIEGIVARTDPYLFDQRGNRITFKYKVRDL